jgi:hypothetical protein
METLRVSLKKVAPLEEDGHR